MSDHASGELDRSVNNPGKQNWSRRKFLVGAARGGIAAASIGSIPALLAACAEPGLTAAPSPTLAPTTGASPAASQAVSRVKLGHLSPLTGTNATGAINLRNGCQLGVDDVMAAGGIAALGGIPLEVIYADSRGDPAVGASEAERLITVEGVSGLMGAYQSGVCRTISEQAERLEVPFLINTGVLEGLTGPDKNFTFRHSAKASDFAKSQVQYIRDIGERTGDPVRTVALIHDNSDFGQSTGEAWRSALGEYTPDIEILLEESIPPNQADLTSTISKIKGAAPDAILIAAYPQADFLLTNGFVQQGVTAKAILFSSGGPSNPAFFSNVGENGEYFYAANNWAGDVSFEGSPDIQARYLEAFGTQMNSIAMMAYSGVWILKEAIEQAKSVDPVAVRDALASIKIDSGPVMAMSSLPVEFDADGQITERPKMVGQVLGSALLTVWPFDVAMTEPVYPQPQS